jgi:hypothetical protein
MDDSALQDRLEMIERRQSIILALLGGLYLLGRLWFLWWEFAGVTVWNLAVGFVGIGLLVTALGTYRRARIRGPDAIGVGGRLVPRSLPPRQPFCGLTP